MQMTDLEKLKTWLATYPGWEDDKPFFVDDATPKPGCVGLFPQGLEQLSLRRDITGGQKAACRYRFYLYRASALEENQEENARWLLDFQNWVEAQSAGGLAPRFGDVPQEERLRAEGGRLQKTGKLGSGLYALTLTAEFTRIY